MNARARRLRMETPLNPLFSKKAFFPASRARLIRCLRRAVLSAYRGLLLLRLIALIGLIVWPAYRLRLLIALTASGFPVALTS